MYALQFLVPLADVKDTVSSVTDRYFIKQNFRLGYTFRESVWYPKSQVTKSIVLPQGWKRVLLNSKFNTPSHKAGRELFWISKLDSNWRQGEAEKTFTSWTWPDTGIGQGSIGNCCIDSLWDTEINFDNWRQCDSANIGNPSLHCSKPTVLSK